MKGLRWSHTPAALKVLRSTQQWGQDFPFSPSDAWCLPGSSAVSCRFHQVTIQKVLPRSQLHSQACVWDAVQRCLPFESRGSGCHCGASPWKLAWAPQCDPLRCHISAAFRGCPGVYGLLLTLDRREIWYRQLQWLSLVTQPGSCKSGFKFFYISPVGLVILWNCHLLYKSYFRQKAALYYYVMLWFWLKTEAIKEILYSQG